MHLYGMEQPGFLNSKKNQPHKRGWFSKDFVFNLAGRRCMQACASLLHLPRKDLVEVFRKVRDALKQGGILYTGFKYGTFEGMRNGRYFTDFTEETCCLRVFRLPP